MKRPRYRNYKVTMALCFRRMTDKQKLVQRQKDRKRRIWKQKMKAYFTGRALSREEAVELLGASTVFEAVQIAL